MALCDRRFVSPAVEAAEKQDDLQQFCHGTHDSQCVILTQPDHEVRAGRNPF
jgi:hypothetical protein